MSNRLLFNDTTERFIIVRKTSNKNSKKVYVGKKNNKPQYAKIGEVGSFWGPKEVQSYGTKANALRRLGELEDFDTDAYWVDGRRQRGSFSVVEAPVHLRHNLV